MSNIKELKIRAKEILNGNWGVAIVASLIVTLLSTGPTVTGMWTYFISMSISIFIAGPLIYGLTYFNINLINNKKGSIIDVFKPFGSQYTQTLIASLLTAFYIFLWALLLVIPGIIKAFSYAMTPYICMNDSNISASEAINESKKMMHGNKLRLFCLYMNFLWILIIWAIIGGLIIGLVNVILGISLAYIGSLLICIYILPYLGVAQTLFFQEVAQSNGLVTIIEQ